MATYKQFYVGVWEMPEISDPVGTVRNAIMAVPNVTTAEELISHGGLRLWHFVVEDTNVNALLTARSILQRIVEGSYAIQFITSALVSNAAGP